MTPTTDNRLRRQLARFSVSSMSNAKWRKLFRVLNVHTAATTQCVWKLVDDPEPVRGHLPDPEQLGYDFIGDCGALNGPVEFVRIEWLFLPFTVPSQPRASDQLLRTARDLQAKIDDAGSFDYEVEPDGLRIFGYR